MIGMILSGTTGSSLAWLWADLAASFKMKEKE